MQFLTGKFLQQYILQYTQHYYIITSWENLFMPYANNRGADQPAHLCSLISTFVVRCLDSIISLVSISEISSLNLASVGEQASLSLTWSQTPKTRLLVTRLILHWFSYCSFVKTNIKKSIFEWEEPSWIYIIIWGHGFYNGKLHFRVTLNKTFWPDTTPPTPYIP